MIQLHHGSNVVIEKIDLTKSKTGKDFGKGFYLNPNYDQAFLWAKSRVKTLDKGTPVVTSFEFNLDLALKENLKVKIFEDYSEEWAEFVVSNRRNNSANPIHPYDIVIGPIADDNVGRQIQFYMQGYWSLNQLVEKIKYNEKKSIQYFFATETSLKFLKPL